MLIDASALAPAHPVAWSATLVEIRRRRLFTLAVSMDPAAFDAALASCDGEALVVPGLGLAPQCAVGWEGHLDRFDAAMPRAAFVGLVGLRRGAGTSAPTLTAQERVFGHVLSAALDAGLLLSLETRGAEPEVVSMLRRHAAPRMVVHAYRGPVRAFRQLIDLGAYMSIGLDALVDPIAREIAATVPAERLLVGTGWSIGHTDTDNRIDTDTDTDTGGSVIRPSRLLEIQRATAAARSTPVGDLQALVRGNFLRLIADDARLQAAWQRAASTFVSD